MRKTKQTHRRRLRNIAIVHGHGVAWAVEAGVDLILIVLVAISGIEGPDAIATRSPRTRPVISLAGAPQVSELQVSKRATIVYCVLIIGIVEKNRSFRSGCVEFAAVAKFRIEKMAHLAARDVPSSRCSTIIAPCICPLLGAWEPPSADPIHR